MTPPLVLITPSGFNLGCSECPRRLIFALLLLFGRLRPSPNVRFGAPTINSTFNSSRVKQINTQMIRIFLNTLFQIILGIYFFFKFWRNFPLFSKVNCVALCSMVDLQLTVSATKRINKCMFGRYHFNQFADYSIKSNLGWRVV